MACHLQVHSALQQVHSALQLHPLNMTRGGSAHLDSMTSLHAGPGHHDADAASVRTSIAIPQSSGLFFYEVKIVSKGRFGYIGGRPFH